MSSIESMVVGASLGIKRFSVRKEVIGVVIVSFVQRGTIREE